MKAKFDRAENTRSYLVGHELAEARGRLRLADQRRRSLGGLLRRPHCRENAPGPIKRMGGWVRGEGDGVESLHYNRLASSIGIRDHAMEIPFFALFTIRSKSRR